MDISHFAAFRQSLTLVASRRGVLAGLSGLLAASPLALGGDESLARRRRKRRKKRKNKKDKKRAVTRADASCPGPSDDLIPITPSGDVRLAQTFSAARSGELVRAELEFVRLDATNGDFVLRLAPVDGAGVPSNTVLAETSVANAAVPEGESPVAFTFADPASVDAGTEYTLVLTRPGGDRFSWAVEAADGCPGQRFSSDDQSAPFEIAGGNRGFVYTTFVRSR
jgi:hypothetical protein